MATADKKNFTVLKLFLGTLVLLLAGGLFFIYSILPGKVAQSIAARAKIHKPLELSPDKFGVKYQDVTAKADGLILSGWWMTADGKNKKIQGTVLLTHGAFKNREQVFTRALFLVKSGYQVLLFDQRGCGLSGESPLSGGVFEADDFLIWTEFLNKQHLLKKPLVYYGFSMGAMSALRAAVKSSGADAVIADSPLANLKSYVSRRTMGGRFSSFPGFLNLCLRAYDSLTGLSLTEEEMDLMPVVQKIPEIPVIYFTGEGDDLAKSEEVRKLFEKTTSRHRRLVYVPEAGHEETYDKYPLIYQKSLMRFLTDLKNGFPKSKD